MADITTRAGKGSPLTNNEVDANFTNLNTDKAENGANSDITSLSGITGGISAADYVDFDVLASAVSRATGRLTWNSSDGCLEVGLIGSDVTQQIGQEMLARVYNADTGTIANGEVVYFHSTAGEIIAAKKYIANGTIDPHLIVGLATEDIAAGAYGYVTEFGFVRSLDTAAYNPGDILFASPSTAGAIQSNEPSTPNDVVRVGICLESDSTNGIVLVNPHDVPRADEIRYDNADSDLTATNVKSAIDELDLVKADIDLLTSNVTFYLTNANDATLTGYKQLVTSTLDTNYDEVAVDYLASGITATAGLIQAWVSDVNVLVGDIAGIVVPIVFNVRKDTGSGDARFYLEVYIRDSLGVETLITTTNVSDYVTSTIYTQLSLSATISLQTFTDTDQVVLKLYGQTDSNTADYEFQLGGASPFRSLFPVPVSVVPSVANAYAIVADTTNFDDKLSSADDTVQKALETLDDHVHQASEITGLTASNTDTNTSQFNGHLSAADDDVQKALNTLDEITLDEVAAQNGTTTQNITVNALLNVDNLRLDGNAITSTDTDGNIALTPNGTGEVDISKVDIDGGAIDGTTIGGTTPGAGTFTGLTVNTTATFAGATIADLGTVTTANIDGGTIDGVTLDATIADIDNIRIDGNSITSTNGNGDISITPNGLGEVNISKVDIDAGAIDGTTIGATSAAAGNFTTLDVATSASFAGASIDDLGTVATADINGGTIDGADITVGTGKTLSVINGTLTLADNQISGDKVHGGIISNFASTGIDDNATSTAITIDSSENTTFAGTITSGDITISEGTPLFRIQDSDGTNQYTQLTNSNGNTYFGSRNDTADGNILIGGYGDGFNEFARWSASGHLTQKNNLIVEGTFTSLGIDDNATSTAITIDSGGHVKVGDTAATPDGVLSIRSDSDAHAISIYEPAGANENWQIGVDADGDLGFYDSGSTTASITFQDGGRVGLGTDSPATLLELAGNNNSGAENNTLRFTDTSNATLTGQALGKIEFKTNDASGDGPLVRAYVGAFAADATPSTYLSFATNLGGAGTVAEERLRINATGRITATTGTSSSAPIITGTAAEGQEAGIKIHREGSTRTGLSLFTEVSGTETDVIYCDSYGNVGINEINPDSNLHLTDVTAPVIRFERDDTNLSAGNGLGQLQFAHKEAGFEGVSATLRVEAGDASGRGMFVFQTGLADTVTDRMYINHDGLVTIDPTGTGDQITHELSVRNDGSPRVTIDHLNGTGSALSSALLFRYSATNAGWIGYLGGQDLNITNDLTAGDIIYETPTEHSFTVGGTEELRITNTETSVFGTSGDIFTLVDTNLTASTNDIGNVRIAWDDSAGTRVAYVGTVNTGDFLINNVYSAVGLAHQNSVKLKTASDGVDITGGVTASGTAIFGNTTTGSGSPRLYVEATGNYTRDYDTGVTGIHIGCNDGTAAQGAYGGSISFGRISSSSDDQSAAIALVQCDADEDQTGLAFFYHGSNTRTVDLIEGMRLDNDGKLGINESNPARHLHVNSGATQVTSLFQSTGTSSYIDFANSTTAQGRSRIGAEGTDTLVFKTEGAERLRILAGGGLTFNGDTATANALDDYEEGTFDVELWDAGTGGNKSATATTGYYTKIGRVVTMNFYALNNIDTTGMTSGNPVFFSLPLTAGATGRHIGTVNHHGFTYVGDTGYQSMMVQTTQSASRGYLVVNGYGRADASVKWSDISTGADDIVTLSVTYHV